jgi:hypothetical protein
VLLACARSHRTEETEVRRTVRNIAVLTATAAAAAGLATAPAHATTPVVKVLVYDQEHSVCENDTSELSVDFPINKDDRVHLAAGGDIWSGVWFQSRTGPAGRYNDYADSRKWPLPGARKFALLAKMDGGYRYAGDTFTRTATDPYQRVALRINDDVPDNGNGCFSVAVKVYR